MTDNQVEELWEDLENVPFNDNDPLDLYLENDWYIFWSGTSRDEIWAWFDRNHSKGISYLLYEYVFSYDR